MSRSTVAKSRAERPKGGPTAPTPAVTHEIVPGKFNENDWNLMIEHDEGDDFVGDIVEEICASALDVIYSNYIQKQLIPFTILQAKDALLQIIEWQFLARDEGEKEIQTDGGWIQDDEPEPAVTDCWAQGSVPKKYVPPATPVIDEEKAEEDEGTVLETEVLEESGAVVEEVEPEDSVPIEESTLEEQSQVDNTMEGSKKEVTLEANKSKAQPTFPKFTSVVSTTAKKGQKSTRRRKFKPYSGLIGGNFDKLTQSLDDTEMEMYLKERCATPEKELDPESLAMPNSCHSIIKLQAGRPPGNRDIIYDEHGNVVSVVKINPARLPTHTVKTNFHVIDPAVEAAQARLEAMRTGRPAKASKPKLSTASSRSTGTVVSSVAPTQAYGSTKEGVTPLPPPLIETMNVAPGVVVKEGDRVKKGPKQHAQNTDLIAAALARGLRPVAPKATLPTVAVQELLRQNPVVRPLRESPIIPPITHGLNSHPPSQMTKS